MLYCYANHACSEVHVDRRQLALSIYAAVNRETETEHAFSDTQQLKFTTDLHNIEGYIYSLVGFLNQSVEHYNTLPEPHSLQHIIWQYSLYDK